MTRLQLDDLVGARYKDIALNLGRDGTILRADDVRRRDSVPPHAKISASRPSAILVNDARAMAIG